MTYELIARPSINANFLYLISFLSAKSKIDIWIHIMREVETTVRKFNRILWIQLWAIDKKTKCNQSYADNYIWIGCIFSLANHFKSPTNKENAQLYPNKPKWF